MWRWSPRMKVMSESSFLSKRGESLNDQQESKLRDFLTHRKGRSTKIEAQIQS
jgi:hypothetical protein